MSTFIKGMTAGIAVGVAAGFMIEPMCGSKHHKLKRSTKGIFRKIGTVIDAVI